MLLMACLSPAQPRWKATIVWMHFHLFLSCIAVREQICMFLSSLWGRLPKGPEHTGDQLVYCHYWSLNVQNIKYMHLFYMSVILSACVVKWLLHGFFKSGNITLMTSWWCHQGYPGLSLETTNLFNRMSALQLGAVGLKVVGVYQV